MCIYNFCYLLMIDNLRYICLEKFFYFVLLKSYYKNIFTRTEYIEQYIENALSI